MKPQNNAKKSKQGSLKKYAKTNRLVYTKRLVYSGAVAALYFVLTVAIPGISYGPIQFRVSEALVLLPVFLPGSVLGLAIGCFLSNIFFSPFGIIDAVIGTAATLLAAMFSKLFKKHILLAGIPPVIFNAFLIPLIWIIDKTDTLYYLNMLSILVSETIAVFALAVPLTLILRRTLPKRFYDFASQKKIDTHDVHFSSKSGDITDEVFSKSDTVFETASDTTSDTTSEALKKDNGEGN